MTILFYVLNSLIWVFSSWNFETPKNLPSNLYRNRIKKQKNIFCFKMTELFLKANRSNFVPIFNDWKILRKADQEISKSLSGTQSKSSLEKHFELFWPSAESAPTRPSHNNQEVVISVFIHMYFVWTQNIFSGFIGIEILESK
jgi:hypothetical protein